jgi:hypothetical protein
MTGEVPARAREIAVRLSALFERDVKLVKRLNDAQRRLLGANEQVWSGAHPDAIRRAFIDYQHASEARRQLAVDVGELSQQLIEVLCASGFTEQAARSADVHELAATGVMLGAWERSR